MIECLMRFLNKIFIKRIINERFLETMISKINSELLVVEYSRCYLIVFDIKFK